ncbi:MAG TPA: molybdopterin oxidoreductase family protein [Steroidobacteraceae bacterium]|nr:molybdopterin oxidoreductase family protein [Steroidobacteraceae bacterium]
MASEGLHHRTCCLCEAMCGFVVEHRDGQVLSIKPNRDDVLSRGHICPKAVALKDLHEDPDRLRRPLRRTAAGSWEEIPWAQAFDEVERRIRALRERHGSDAIAIYAGNPTVHNLGAMLGIGDFIRALRTKNLYSATSVDQLPHMVASWAMFGHQFLLPVPDVDRTQLFVCIGGNPVASAGSIMGAPGFEKRIDALRARGGRFVVIDPRRTESAAIADEYLGIRPGTDVYLLLALLNEVFRSGRVRLEHLAPFADGLEALREAVQRFDPVALAERTTIPRARIAELAQALLDEPRALVYGRVGACTQEFGGLTLWLIYCLNAVTGHLDREGGMMFAEPAVDLTRAYGAAGHYGKWRSRVRGLPEFGNELPVAALAEEITTPGEGQVRALVSFAGNPVLSTPNGGQLDGALARLDFMVAVDFYLNETTRHAHLILPPASPLERSHYDIALSGFAVRNVAKFSPALFPKPAEALHDHEILAELTRRLRKRPAQPAARLALRAKDLLARRLGPDGALDWMLKTGRYGVPDAGAWRLVSRAPGFGRLRKLLAATDRRPVGLSLKRLLAAPNGVDLGPLEQALPRRLATRDKRLPLAPPLFLADLARAAEALARPAPALTLIGRRHVRSNNSWLHNSHRLVKGKPRCTLLIHPRDAASRGIVDGSTVRVSSRVGRVDVVAEVTTEIEPGVVSLPHGWGHGRPGVRLAVASAHAGVSINDLVDDQQVDALTGTAILNGTPVEVAAVTVGEAVATTAS